MIHVNVSAVNGCGQKVGVVTYSQYQCGVVSLQLVMKPLKVPVASPNKILRLLI